MNSILDIATYLIQKYVDKNFIATYWLEHTHGKVEYKLVALYALKRLESVLPYYEILAFENQAIGDFLGKMYKITNQVDLRPRDLEVIKAFNIDDEELDFLLLQLVNHSMKYHASSEKNVF